MLTVDLEGLLPARKQLQALALTPAKRKRFHKQLGQEVIKTGRANIRAQRTLDGRPMTPRKNGKAKVLRRMMRGVKAWSGPNQVKVSWTNTRAGQVARAHQEGQTERMTAAKAARRAGTPDYDAPATRTQARALIKEGYRHPRGGRVSMKWITEHMSLGQAGVVLRSMRDAPPKQSWEIETPARPFFGLTRGDIKHWADHLITTLTRSARKRH